MNCAVVAMAEPQRTHVQLSAKNTHVKAQNHQVHQQVKNVRIKISSTKTRIERMIHARSTGRIKIGVDSTMTLTLSLKNFAALVAVARRTVNLILHPIQTFASTQPQQE
jgi:predicted aspartyl protease